MMTVSVLSCCSWLLLLVKVQVLFVWRMVNDGEWYSTSRIQKEGTQWIRMKGKGLLLLFFHSLLLCQECEWFPIPSYQRVVACCWCSFSFQLSGCFDAVCASCLACLLFFAQRQVFYVYIIKRLLHLNECSTKRMNEDCKRIVSNRLVVAGLMYAYSIVFYNNMMNEYFNALSRQRTEKKRLDRLTVWKEKIEKQL